MFFEVTVDVSDTLEELCSAGILRRVIWVGATEQAYAFTTALLDPALQIWTWCNITLGAVG